MKKFIIVFAIAFVFASCAKNEPPSVPSNPYPPDYSTVPSHVNFSWKCDDPDGDKLTYNLFINYASVLENLTEPFYTKDLMPGSIYTWSVIARDSEHTVQGPIWTFTTESKLTVIADETVNIGAGSYRQYQIYGKTGDKVHYEVRSNLDVNVWFMSGDDMVKFANNQSFLQYTDYSGQRVFTLTKDFGIPVTGFYYLVVDNTFSLFTSKTVYVKITIG